jgi:uncharacterized protein (DUF433 family)
MTAVTTSHIVIDDQGRPLIEGTRTKVIMVVMDKMNGMTPEEIHEAYPDLSLAQIHAALVYYYDHKAELDAEIARQSQEYEQLRAAAGESRFVKRMRSEGKLP